ncbi:MAG: aldehyde dehydrogenase family protein [Porticoccaceae bacterium]|nr:aldehyde dehydrogenase family protein [Porticoccaceae bacterium]
MTYDFNPLVNNQFPTIKNRFDAINPATGEVIGSVPECASVVDDAVKGAQAAQKAWAEVPLFGRIAKLAELTGLIEKHGEELAELDVLDTGSPRQVMMTDAAFAVAFMRFQTGLAPQVLGKGGDRWTGDNIHFTMPQPFGVVARFCAFNHPMLFSALRIAAPLLMGNALIIKPSEHTSLSTLRMGEILAPHIPPGLIQILTGGAAVGEAIVGHKDIKRITLTGGKNAALAFYGIAAKHGYLKDFTFELGGKNPMVIYPDANTEQAFQSAVHGMNFYQTAGQSCGSTTRVFIHRSIYEDAKKAIKSACESIIIGDPQHAETMMGSLSTRQQFEKTLKYIQISKDEGLPLLTGGERLMTKPLDKGYFVPPTVFYDVGAEHTLFKEEVFGPVLALIPWDDEEQMLVDVNAVEYGLTASVWTQDIDRAMGMARHFNTGTVWINGSAKHFPGFGFSGAKNSGVGTEENLEELESFCQMKAVHYFGAEGRKNVEIGL